MVSTWPSHSSHLLETPVDFLAAHCIPFYGKRPLVFPTVLFFMINLL